MGAPSFVERRLFRPPRLYEYPSEVETNLVDEYTAQIFGAVQVPSIVHRHHSPAFVGVFIHGNAENIIECAWYTRFLSDALRADVYAPEFPGYWNDRAGCVKPATERQCFDDIENFVGELVRLETLNGRNLPVVLIGYSTGCALALHAADVHRSERFPHAVMLMAPFVSACSVVLASRWWQLPFGFLYKPIDAFSMREAASRANHPLLIVHGAKDPVVPVAHGRAIYDWARAVQPDKTIYLEIEDATHDSVRLDPQTCDFFLECMNMIHEEV